MAVPEFCAYQVRTRVLFGAGITRELGEHLGRLPASRWLLVTDPVLAKLGFVDRIREGLEASGLELGAVFEGVKPNSETRICEAGAEMGRQAECDGVIGLGGGSSMDTAKAISLLLSGELGLLEYEGAQILGSLVGGPLKPMVCIPTTAGTGSEVTNCAVVLDEASGRKVSFLDDLLMPDLALLDADLTRNLPPRLAAATGMDALTHAVEAYVDLQRSPFSDACALEAVGLIHRSLRRAVADGKQDDEARAEMLLASNLAGIAFTHSMVGVIHGISHAIGGLWHSPHGECNAVILPHGMRFNLEAETGRFARLGRELGAPRELDDEAAAGFAIESVVELREALYQASGLPRNLRELGIPGDGTETLVEKAMEEGSMLYNPRPVDPEGVREIVTAAA